VHIAELAAAAGLLLVPSLLAHGSTNRLAVGNARLRKLHVDPEAALELLDDHIHLQVAGRLEQGLVE